MTSEVLSNVSFHEVLTQVTVSLPAGQMVGLVGPNGAGKSSLIRLAAGIWRPTQGSVQVEGREVSSWTARDRAQHIAYLPQHLPDDISYTVRGFVEMGCFAWRTPLGHLPQASRSAVDEAILRLNLNRYEDVPLSRLSGGERQRAGIARCLAQQSPILLLDEPTANLDLFYQLEIMDHLQRLTGEGKLIVLAIHDLELAARFCSRLLLLSAGRVEGYGPPSEVVTERALSRVFRVMTRTYADPFAGSLRLSASPPASRPVGGARVR